MKIKSAKFHISSPDLDSCPRWLWREFAFVGRSNVGKSSLINMLTHKSGLAKVSARPGKTQLINFFVINEAWSLVDLPGYGFAKTAKDRKYGFSVLIRDYLEGRENLTCVFVLIDSRLPPQQIDLDFLRWLNDCGVRHVLVYTKADKVSAAKVRGTIELMMAEVAGWRAEPLQVIVSSSKTGSGRQEVLGEITKVMEG
ncbi:MAG: ribosome biogenesis GTP-binding protein YihA/YsxC [Akkermansiaceae bacterium]|nr:ribosome biogenesis GTP-binding protein YihA/YsxC [Akkermansiaceae bacterium]MCF7733751.1 ribosome biogenesis GTP-binding protein YihA/YsxC [Akkermansiaceae bacterium]